MRHSAFVCFLLATVAVQPPAWAQAPSTPSLPEQLPGLWGNETSFGPKVQGALTVDGRQSEWRVRIAGFDVAAKRTGADVTFALPGEHGAFRGRLSPDEKALEGFWIQPPGMTLSAAYATPLRLRATSSRVWEGSVKPLADTSSMYLRIQREPEGSLTGFIRNPEFNFGLRRPFKLEVQGNALTFVNTRRKNDTLRGFFDEETGHISLRIQGVGQFEFSRRDENSAPRFYPRTPGAPAYVYRPPVPSDDGWKTATLESVKLDPKPIAALMESIQGAAATDVHAPYIHALLIARHGKLVVEEYFHGHGRDQVHDTRSAGKTLASVLLGIALEQKKGVDVHTPLSRLLPRYEALFQDDPRKQRLTAEHLMTMTSGLACDDGDGDSPGNEDVMQSQRAQRDWYRYALALPMSREPGGAEAVYCSAGINLLGAIVSQQSGMALPEFFEQRFARPLDIRDYHMNLMPTGEGYLGGGIYLRPRDALKLGQVFLSGGRWNQRQVVSPRWVEASTRRHARFSDDHGYGYAWHLHDLKVGDRTYRQYAAEGNGGQFVIVVPELDLTVMIAAANYGDFTRWYRFQDLVPQYVIPAVLDAPVAKPRGSQG
ncbi:serine hydrolase domain-containing protein [Myxococcus sp. Y35]|uniref:serine hydrolase domain-containing protein n=1 Tax=Pseudomyxococcus flavus TaxID=3115648 RepID=UPI003CF6F773